MDITFLDERVLNKYWKISIKFLTTGKWESDQVNPKSL